MSEWSAWGVVVLVIMSFLVYDMLRRAKEKLYIKAYTEITTKKGGKTFSELDTIGEFKGDRFNPERRCYEFRFRKNFEYFTVYSNYTMTQLIEVHKIERIYLIFFSLNAYLYKKKIDKPYQKELGWTLQAYIYRGLSYLFNLTPSGLCFSLLICGSIFYFAMPQFSFAFLIGCLMGFIISTCNYFLRKSEIIQESLLKKKTRMIDTEFYLSPLESETEILDIYHVKGTIQKKVKTSDNVMETQTTILKDNAGKGFEGAYKTVKGYDELYKLLINPLVTLEEYKLAGMESRKRTDQEMLNLKRSYLTRNRAFAEDLFRAKEELERLQKEYRHQQIQMQHTLETKDVELKDALRQITAERERQGITLVNIYKELLGAEFVSENFESTHLRVMNQIEKVKEQTKVNEISNLISLIGRLFELIGQKANVDVTELMQLLKINEVKENGAKEGS